VPDAYVVSAVRTASGRRGGRLAGWHPADLGGAILDGLIDATGVDPAAIDDVIMGCVSQGGEQSSQIARGAVLASKLPPSVPAVTIDRQCGSSQQAIHFAAQGIMSGTQHLVVAAGVESMTRVPMGSTISLFERAGLGKPKSPRQEARFPGVEFSQFTGAELMARKHNLSRAELDAFALQSHRRAAAASASGAFEAEILRLEIDCPEGPMLHTTDETIRPETTLESISAVAALRPGGLITAANASPISDGASALLIASEHALSVHRLNPIARIDTLAVTAGDPVIMLDEPINATRRVLKQAGLTIEDIDLYEVNEAFACVPLAWLRALNADSERLNVHGGAIALGHPLGATGTKLAATLIHALRRYSRRFGLQAMCEGGGLANATIFERV
jgi:acetyl-CoA C-acetyltransferase